MPDRTVIYERGKAHGVVVDVDRSEAEAILSAAQEEGALAQFPNGTLIDPDRVTGYERFGGPDA